MKRGKPLRKRKKNRTRKDILFDNAWKVCSEYIRRRDKGRCYTCSKIGSWKYDMEAGHFKHGKSTPIYFEKTNINSQCTRCNRLLSGNRDIYLRNIQKEYGIEHGDWLMKEGRKVHRWKVGELEEIISQYKTLLIQLEEKGL